MENIEWRDEYLLGNELIDAHHRIFFGMVHDLCAMEQGGDKSLDSREVLQFIVDYVAMHFSAEEQLMERIGYPHLSDHAAIHAAFAEKIDSLIQQAEANPELPALDELLDLPQEWFLDHIIGEDLKLRSWIESAS